jgi:hypothetical protein
VLLSMLARTVVERGRRHKLAEMPLCQQTCNHSISSTRTRSQTTEKRTPVQQTWSSNHLSLHIRDAATGRPQLGIMRACLVDRPPSRSGIDIKSSPTRDGVSSWPFRRGSACEVPDGPLDADLWRLLPIRRPFGFRNSLTVVDERASALQGYARSLDSADGIPCSKRLFSSETCLRRGRS